MSRRWGYGVHRPHNRNLGPIAQQSLQFYHRVFISGPLLQKILGKIAHILSRGVYMVIWSWFSCEGTLGGLGGPSRGTVIAGGWRNKH